MTSQQSNELEVIEAYPEVGILVDQTVHWFGPQKWRMCDGVPTTVS